MTAKDFPTFRIRYLNGDADDPANTLLIATLKINLKFGPQCRILPYQDQYWVWYSKADAMLQDPKLVIARIVRG